MQSFDTNDYYATASNRYVDDESNSHFSKGRAILDSGLTAYQSTRPKTKMQNSIKREKKMAAQISEQFGYP